jgi:hypothetical protein
VAQLLAAIAAEALTTSTLFARIGETEQECAARYGEPIKKRPNSSLLYQKSDLKFLSLSSTEKPLPLSLQLFNTNPADSHLWAGLNLFPS